MDTKIDQRSKEQDEKFLEGLKPKIRTIIHGILREEVANRHTKFTHGTLYLGPAEIKLNRAISGLSDGTHDSAIETNISIYCAYLPYEEYYPEFDDPEFDELILRIQEKLEERESKKKRETESKTI